MLMVKVSFEYNDIEKVKALSDEVYTQLRTDFPELDLNEVRGTWLSINETFMDIEEVDKFTAYGLTVTVKKIKGLHYPNGLEQPSTSASNVTITNVSVPNHNLFIVDTVDWLENACTQELQSRLNGGWRILAVCPSNDARRPDYILGKQAQV